MNENASEEFSPLSPGLNKVNKSLLYLSHQADNVRKLIYVALAAGTLFVADQSHAVLTDRDPVVNVDWDYLEKPNYENSSD